MSKKYYIVAFHSEDRKSWYYEKMYCTLNECKTMCENKISDKTNNFTNYHISSPNELMNNLYSTFLTSPYVYHPETQEWYTKLYRINFKMNIAK